MTQGNGRVAVVTGASAGIGKAAAKALAAQGWRVIGVGRNRQRSEEALEEIRQASTGAPVDMVVADLAEVAQSKRAAAEINGLTLRIDALLNNAGGIGKERVVTSEGNEAIFAGNYLGPFVLTRELLPLLRIAADDAKPGSVRVLNVSSSAADLSPGLAWDDIQSLEKHHASPAYCNVKLANLMFSRSLGKRLASEGILVKAMHPGTVDTNFASYGDAELQAIVATLADITVSAEQGADTLVWLATEPHLPAGEYFHERTPAGMPPFAQNDANCERLWSETEAIIVRSSA